jgi:uncharacterized protein (DUF608 family)
MTLRRRDVLKILSAAPFMGALPSRAVHAQASSGLASTADTRIWRAFEEPFLGEIAFPLGGIGTGTVSLGGRGELRDWEVCNRPDKGRTLDNTFFGLWFREGDHEPRAYVLESTLRPPYRGAFGINRAGLPGMPRLERARFLGSYPFARIELSDPNVPLDVSLEAFNPFIPTNDADSGLPVAIFYWHVTNRSSSSVELSLVGSLQNIAGVRAFGDNANVFAATDALRGIHMTTTGHLPDSARFGSLAIATTATNAIHTARWDGNEWFDAQSLFWNTFAATGQLAGIDDSGPSPAGRTHTGSVGSRTTLAPGDRVTVPFILAWHFPNRDNYWMNNIFGYEPDQDGPILGNYYANDFGDAWEVASYVAANLPRLEGDTRRFHDALFQSTVPPEVLDAVSSQSSIIRTNTCFRTRSGNFHAFEGVGDDHGCCPLNCTHVWNYAQSLAHLFPALERTMREVDFGHNTDERGFMVFRTRVPLGTEKWDFPHAAADGQMGTIVRLYREWQLSGDDEFLRRLWPGAKRAMAFAWTQWDTDEDGVMEAVQHNTYDIEFTGPNPMMGAIYLTALRCMETMATAQDEPSLAVRYRALYERGRTALDGITWNGEYYAQVYERAQEDKYQVGDGCLSDQLLGQWMAHIVDAGHVLPEARVRSAIAAVHRHNFRSTLTEHYNPQRIYALGDEGGLLLCSWPRGNRPPLPFVYSDEVWTGIEYQVAAHLLYEGFVDEGVEIVKAVRNRYDGQRRNPWNEIECGHHYARAMASWSLLLAYSGFHFSAPRQRIAFRPVVTDGRFATFWSAGPGWGTYEQERDRRRTTATLSMLYGADLTLTVLEVPRPAAAAAAGGIGVRARFGDTEVAASVRLDGERVEIALAQPVTLAAGGRLEVELTAR